MYDDVEDQNYICIDCSRRKEIGETQTKKLWAVHDRYDTYFGIFDGRHETTPGTKKAVNSVRKAEGHNVLNKRIMCGIFVCLACIFGKPHLCEAPLSGWEPATIVRLSW